MYLAALLIRSHTSDGDLFRGDTISLSLSFFPFFSLKVTVTVRRRSTCLSVEQSTYVYVLLHSLFELRVFISPIHSRSPFAFPLEKAHDRWAYVRFVLNSSTTGTKVLGGCT
jgi:hypothetical protein